MPISKKVFISYAREDSKTARRLHADLKQNGFAPWLDEYDLEAGQNWRQFIPHEIRKSDYLILLLSQRSVSKRGFVQVEQKLALEVAEEFPDFDIFVVPTRVDDCEIPPRLADINCTDLFPDYERGLDRMIRALQVERRSDHPPAPETPPPPARPPSVYVSYCVIDNNNDWVSTFVHHLQDEIAMRLGTTDGFSIFMDDGAVSGFTPIPEEIINQIESADLFIAVTSPGYFNSERCARERSTFLRHSDKLVWVEREKVESDRLPEEFRALRPNRFWVQDRQGKPPRILGHPTLNQERNAHYYEIINDMSYDLAEKLQCIQPRAEVADQCAPPPETSDLAPVFLAEVTDDLIVWRDKMERHLVQAGLRVVPQNPLAMDQAAIQNELKPCRVFVQLLSHLSGQSRSDQPGKCRLQFDCAQAASKTVLQWRATDLAISQADPDQQALLNGPGVMAVKFEAFKKEVASRARFQPSPRPQAPDVMVFVNAAKSDERHAQEVYRLMENRQIGAVLPVWEGDEQELLEDMEAFILESHGVVVVYGNVHALWVRKQIRYCRSLNFRRQEPLRALGVYDAPEPDKPPLNLQLPGLAMIDCRDCLNEDAFRPFLDALCGGGAS